jgi:polyisoprenoid-binding protein YceI
MMITTVRGNFDKFSGTVNFDEKNLDKSVIDVTIEAASVNTREEKRDGHLMSPDFFDVAQFPTITFKSTSIKVTSGNKGIVTGDLTIKGITKEISLETELVGIAKNPFGATMAGFNASAKINRKDWNLGWNVALEAGGWLVGEEVSINLEIELAQVPETATA